MDLFNFWIPKDPRGGGAYILVTLLLPTPDRAPHLSSLLCTSFHDHGPQQLLHPLYARRRRRDGAAAAIEKIDGIQRPAAVRRRPHYRPGRRYRLATVATVARRRRHRRRRRHDGATTAQGRHPRPIRPRVHVPVDAPRRTRCVALGVEAQIRPAVGEGHAVDEHSVFDGGRDILWAGVEVVSLLYYIRDETTNMLYAYWEVFRGGAPPEREQYVASLKEKLTRPPPAVASSASVRKERYTGHGRHRSLSFLFFADEDAAACSPLGTGAAPPPAAPQSKPPVVVVVLVVVPPPPPPVAVAVVVVARASSSSSPPPPAATPPPPPCKNDFLFAACVELRRACLNASSVPSQTVVRCTRALVGLNFCNTLTYRVQYRHEMRSKHPPSTGVISKQSRRRMSRGFLGGLDG